jgi:hypothetical protein
MLETLGQVIGSEVAALGWGASHGMVESAGGWGPVVWSQGSRASRGCLVPCAPGG